ncbi:unnamed protein product [Lathyrus sativus]|nr:unnamed protein product [Lathyrus sativus]
MEFKFRAVDYVKPPSTTSHSLSPLTYLPPDRSLQLDGSFSGLRMPLSGEAALRRELEKEQIRWEILRRRELEEEVRRELAMERELGISIQRPLMNMQGLMPHWSSSTVMNPVSLAHFGASQPQSIFPPAEINPSPEISDKGKVIVLAKPDPELFNAKRKATTPPVSKNEPLAFSLKKKSKEEWSCALCEVKATSESGLNAHLNGKKHKAREAAQRRKIARRNKKSRKNVKATQTVVATTELGADAVKDQQLLQPCTALEVMNETVIDKGVEESKKEEQLVKTVTDNENITQSKNEEQLGETVDDNGGSVIKSTNEDKLVEMMISNDVIKFENGRLLVEKSQNVGSLENKKDAAIDEVKKINATESENETFVATTVGKNESESKIEEQLVETVADNGVSVIKSTDGNKLVEKKMVDNDVINFENGRLLVEKSQSVGSLESKKDAAMEEGKKISALTKRRKVEPLWCEICQISTFSKSVMEGHVKGKKHIKRMKKFGQNNVSPPSTLFVSQKPSRLIKDA